MSATKTHPVYIVRGSDGYSCGHNHREVRTGVNCLQRELEQRARWGPTGVLLQLFRVDAGGIATAIVGGNI